MSPLNTPFTSCTSGSTTGSTRLSMGPTPVGGGASTGWLGGGGGGVGGGDGADEVLARWHAGRRDEGGRERALELEVGDEQPVEPGCHALSRTKLAGEAARLCLQVAPDIDRVAQIATVPRVGVPVPEG